MRLTISLPVLALLCAAVPQSAAVAQAPAAQPRPTGYLSGAAPLDIRALLPEPPAPGTPGHTADRAAYEAALAGKDGRGWKRAVSQASPRSPQVQAQLMCALGVRIDPAAAPAFMRVMTRTAVDLSAASEQAKAAFGRSRPYAGEANAVTCDPGANFGTQSPSYPSGHAAIGWMWGLMLAELAPERANEALAWGREIGDNRIACRVHYPTDIAAGRTLGAALLARLHGNPAFRADLEAARSEIAAARGSGAKPDCSGD